MAQSDSLLDVSGVGVRFGGVVALDDLSFTIEHGEICSLIGPNGAGKTTLFNVVSRLYETSQGTVRFDGVDLLALPPHRIAGKGIARTFQNLALVPGLSVLDNVMIGGHSVSTGGFWLGSLGLSGRIEQRLRGRRDGVARRGSTSNASPSDRAAGCPTAPSSGSRSRGR